MTDNENSIDNTVVELGPVVDGPDGPERKIITRFDKRLEDRRKDRERYFVQLSFKALADPRLRKLNGNAYSLLLLLVQHDRTRLKSLSTACEDVKQLGLEGNQRARAVRQLEDALDELVIIDKRKGRPSKLSLTPSGKKLFHAK